jgi:geranylgeranyl diphosphate synthase type II
MNIHAYLASQKQSIEDRLQELVPIDPITPWNELYVAARYALLGGGKRLRPILALATNQTMGGEAASALTPACSLEMIHAYSLIHDDLPAMDDDDFRRGKPTLHKVYPEGHAILTGDYLLTRSFEVIAYDPDLSAEQKIQLIQILTKASGGHGMIAGQVMDLNAVNQEIDLQTLQQIHKCKTGAMIAASVEFGGVIAQTPPPQLSLLRSFGDHMGLAYQIVDDILDVTESLAKHGKSIGSDLMNGKTTYVSLMGLDQAKASAQDCLHRALAALDKLPNDTSLLKDLANILINRMI